MTPEREAEVRALLEEGRTLVKEAQEMMDKIRMSLMDCPECGSFETNAYQTLGNVVSFACNRCLRQWDMPASRLGLAAEEHENE